MRGRELHAHDIRSRARRFGAQESVTGGGRFDDGWAESLGSKIPAGNRIFDRRDDLGSLMSVEGEQANTPLDFIIAPMGGRGAPARRHHGRDSGERTLGGGTGEGTLKVPWKLANKLAARYT